MFGGGMGDTSSSSSCSSSSSSSVVEPPKKTKKLKPSTEKVFLTLDRLIVLLKEDFPSEAENFRQSYLPGGKIHVKASELSFNSIKPASSFLAQHRNGYENDQIDCFIDSLKGFTIKNFQDFEYLILPVFYFLSGEKFKSTPSTFFIEKSE